MKLSENGVRYAMGAGLFAAWPLLIWMEHALPDMKSQIEQMITFVQLGLTSVTSWHFLATDPTSSWSKKPENLTEPAAPAAPKSGE